MSVFLAALDNTIVTTALPTIAEHFVAAAGFVWVGSAFMLAAAVTTANWGKFSDVWGRKPVLLVASAVFFLGCGLCGGAKSLAMLIGGRVVQGVGAGGLLTLVNIIIGDLFPPRERGKYYGMIGMVWATASALGPVYPVSGTAFFIILLVLKLPSPKTSLIEGLKAVDWIGSLFVTGGTLMLLMGLQFGGTSFPWKSATVICLIIFGVVSLVIFGFVEQRVAKYPVIPISLFRPRSNYSVVLVCLLHGMSFTQILYYLPIYFQAVLGATPLLSGVYLIASCIPLSLGASCSGVVLKKTGRYNELIRAGFVLGVIGSALLCDLPRGENIPSHSSAWARIILFQIIVGIGLGLNFQPPLVALQSSVSPQYIATVTSAFAMTRNVGSAIGVVVASAAFSNEMNRRHGTVLRAVNGDPKLAEALTGAEVQANLILVDHLPSAAKQIVRRALFESLRPVWIEAACFLAAGFLVSLLVQRRHLDTTQEMVKTGIEGEKERRRLEMEAKAAKKQQKAQE